MSILAPVHVLLLALGAAPDGAGLKCEAVAPVVPLVGLDAPARELPFTDASDEASEELEGTGERSSEAMESSVDEPVELDIPSRLEAPPIATAHPLAPESDLLAKAQLVDGKLKVSVDGGERTLTIDAVLQRKLQGILQSYRPPYAAVVALEPATGRVLAMAEYSRVEPTLRGLCSKALYPAASIFKIVTAAALLESGVSPDAQECFHGGRHKLDERLLLDSERDSRCYGLSKALAMSANVVFAKMTRKYLSPEKLLKVATAFGFNRPFPFPIPTDMSLASIPSDEFAFSCTGAGFGDVFLSPLHGAALAAVAANKGLWRAPVLFEKGDSLEAPTERVVSEETARALSDMMQETVKSGTARRIFRQRGYRVEGAVGKTGSLADKRPFRDYSWFVGFAPKDSPKVAVAAVVVNEALWRIRATFLGREAMRLYLGE